MADPPERPQLVPSASRPDTRSAPLPSDGPACGLFLLPSARQLNATTIPAALLGQTLKEKEGKDGKATRDKDSAGTNKRKRGAAAKKEKEKEKDRPAPSAPPMQEIKLPDKYRLLPVPKSDAAHA